MPLWVAMAVFVLMTNCGDDTVSPDVGVEPEIPLLQDVQINSTYFEENIPSDQDLQNPDPYFPYLTARETVISADASLQSVLEFPGLFLLVTSQREPEYENDVWVWSFQYTVEGTLIDQEDDFIADVFVTADVDESADQVEWDFRLSGTGSPFGDLDDFQVFDASTNLNNSTGQFRFFSPENPDTPILDLLWEIPVPNEKEIMVTLLDFPENGEENELDEPLILTLDYIENESEYSLTLLQASELQAEINWNTENETGSIDSEDGVYCWDEDMRVTDC